MYARNKNRSYDVSWVFQRFNLKKDKNEKQTIKSGLKQRREKNFYNTNETTGLLNVHMPQSISTENDPTNFPNPFLLSAYGVNNKFTSINILRRWIYIW
jgi:hypothetical protein